MDVNWFKMAYTLLGGLGLFFYGMKLLSEGLQASANQKIRQAINQLTNNRLVAIAVGLGITCFVQSSSITTVMVIGFVNAGLMELSQAIGVILGANIGTTITGWMISIKVGKYSLLLIGLGILPLLFSKNERISSLGRILFAMGLVFLGLNTMSDAFKPLRSNEGFLLLMSFFSATNYLTLWMAVIIGCFLTFIIQSSSAMLGITIALAISGSITYQTALALVLGENIGTTITAYLAGIGANSAAKRAAIAHGIFNIVGVLIITSIFWTYKDFVDMIISGDPDFINSQGQKPYIATHIAAGHTIFNVANVILFIPFIGLLEKITFKIIPDSPQKEMKKLKILGRRSTISAPIAIEEAFQEVSKLSVMTLENLGNTKEYLSKDKEQNLLRKKIQKYEVVSDNIQTEVILFLNQVMTKTLTNTQSQQINAILQISDELESINDYALAITRQVQKSFQTNMNLNSQSKKELLELFQLLQELYEKVTEDIISKSSRNIDTYTQQREGFILKAQIIKKKYLDRFQEGDTSPLLSFTFNNILNSLYKIEDHTLKLTKSCKLFC